MLWDTGFPMMPYTLVRFSIDLNLYKDRSSATAICPGADSLPDVVEQKVNIEPYFPASSLVNMPLSVIESMMVGLVAAVNKGNRQLQFLLTSAMGAPKRLSKYGRSYPGAHAALVHSLKCRWQSRRSCTNLLLFRASLRRSGSIPHG